MERCLMLDVVSPFILWPIGMALGGLLFFEITKRSSRAEQSVVPCRVDARSISPEHGGCLMLDVVSPFILWPIGHWSACGRANGPSDERLPDRRIY
jgi:hypothetical protein